MQEYLLWVVIAIGVWLLLRPVFIWYWKIDRVINLLEMIVASQPNKPVGPNWKCRQCGESNPIGVVRCLACGTEKV
jgi:hypothetical protein